MESVCSKFGVIHVVENHSIKFRVLSDLFNYKHASTCSKEEVRCQWESVKGFNPEVSQ